MSKLDVKLCSDCKLVKLLHNFYWFKSKNNYNTRCNDCEKIRSKEKYTPYKKEKQKALYHKDIEKSRADARRRNKALYHKDIEKSRLKEKEKSKRKYEKNKNNPFYKIKSIISRQVRDELKRNGTDKNGNSSSKYLEYTVEQLKNHIESLWEPWMTWENWGKYDIKTWNDEDPKTWKWQLDHIVPQSELKYSSMKDDNFKKCWALENLRPYSAKYNILEGNKRTVEEIENIKLYIKNKL